jgi:replicative DNA helicase
MSTAPNINIDPGAPFSQEAEEAVIGSILIDPAAFISVAAFLKSNDFFMLRHQYIWQAFERLNTRAEPIDHITLAEELENMQVLDTIGGRAYIIQLANNTGTSMYAEVYGRLVERTSIRRKLMVTADEIKKLAMDEKLNIDTVVSEAESKLFSVTEAQVKRDFVPMWDALSDYYDRMEYMLQHRTEAVGLPTGYRDLDTLLGGFQKSDLLIIAARPGMGKCLSGITSIFTVNGTKTLQTLKPQNIAGEADDEGGIYYPLELDILTLEGIRKTSHFYDAGEKPTLKITTRAGYQVSGTYNHPLFVLNKQAEKVWVRLEDLKVGDFVAIQRCDALFGNVTELPKVSKTRNAVNKPIFPSNLDLELAYILGLLVGDGNVNGNSGRMELTCDDPEIAQYYIDWASSINVPINTKHKQRYIISNVEALEWVQQLGVKGYAYEKTVPQIILNAPKDCVRAFLQGLFDTDGHSEVQKGYIQFATTSEQLARQVHIMLLQFGIVSKLSRKENAYRGAWLIRITGDNARKFYDNVGFRLSRKQERRNLLPEVSNGNLDLVPYLPQRQSVIPHSEKTNLYRYFNGKRAPSYDVLGRIAAHAPEVHYLLEPEYYWDEIVSIEDDGLQHCYDLVVPEVHSYIANGIVSHNTSWLLTTAMNTARFGARVAIFTMEMGVEQLIQRMVAMETGINVQKLRLAKLSPQEASRFTEAIGRISNYHIFIDDSPAISPMEMRTKVRRLKHEYGLDLIIVDYMQLMNAGGTFENNRVQEISLISRSLKEMARELNVPLISAAQLSRAVEQRQDKRPVLSDLRESGSIEQDSDIVMFLYRDEIYNEATEFPNQADVIVAKHRNGPTGTVSLYFEKSLTKFMDASVHRVDLSGLE